MSGDEDRVVDVRCACLSSVAVRPLLGRLAVFPGWSRALWEPDLILEVLGGRVVLSTVEGVDGNEDLMISEGSKVGVSAAAIFTMWASGTSCEEC